MMRSWKTEGIIMAMHHQTGRGVEKGGKSRRSTPSNRRHVQQKDRGELLRDLLDALRQGVVRENMLWPAFAYDWIASIQVADIDDDGEMEILVGSRDGYVR